MDRAVFLKNTGKPLRHAVASAKGVGVSGVHPAGKANATGHAIQLSNVPAVFSEQNVRANDSG